MIRREELNKQNYPTSTQIENNLDTLLKRMNVIREAYAKPMIVTSGLRSDAKQLELIIKGLSQARKSNHLVGAACDILDKDGELGKWCLKNEELLAETGLWCEHPKASPGWVHFQIFPPNSGKRFFLP